MLKSVLSSLLISNSTSLALICSPLQIALTSAGGYLYKWLLRQAQQPVVEHFDKINNRL